MADEQQPEPEPVADEPRDAPAEERKRTRVRRLAVRAGAVLLAIVVGLLVSVLTFDLGPSLKGIAEGEGSKYLQRPMHIGRLSSRLVPGVFVVEDLTIEGLTPADRPFLTAKKITVRVPWWSVATRKLVIESVDMTDWNMLVE